MYRRHPTNVFICRKTIELQNGGKVVASNWALGKASNHLEEGSDPERRICKSRRQKELREF